MTAKAAPCTRVTCTGKLKLDRVFETPAGSFAHYTCRKCGLIVLRPVQESGA